MFLLKAFMFILFINFHLFASDTLNDTSYDYLWKAYQIKYGKKYLLEEERIRRVIWELNVKAIAKHNLEADLGLKSYNLELNKFSDKTPEELHSLRKCINSNSLNRITVRGKLFNSKRWNSSLPSFVDWRKNGFVTAVKNQGDCGSCWAFSSTGSLEGQNKAKTGKLTSLSEQNLVDCSWKQGNEGCNGGWMEYAFQYVVDNHGIDTEESYKYKGEDGHCKFKRNGIGANCTNYYRIKSNSELDLQSAVANIGPISVAICVTDKFLHYNWGTDWGMNGYILMSRNAGNQCGIATHAVFPIV